MSTHSDDNPFDPSTLPTVTSIDGHLLGEHTANVGGLAQTLVATLARASRRPSNPLALAHRALVQELVRVAVPSIDTVPDADQFEDVADYIVKVAEIADRWLRMVGEEVRSNASEGVDLKDFTDQFKGAVEGNATFHLDRAAEAVRHEQEAEAGTRYCHSRHGFFRTAAE